MTPARSSSDRRATLRFPRAGRYWLLTAALLVTVGLCKGINLLTLLGFLAGMLWPLNWWLAGRGLRWLHGRRRVARPVFAGTPFAIEWTVTNPRKRGPFAVLLGDHGLRQPLRWFAARLGGGETRTFQADITLPARGRYVWGELRASSGHPFGLVEREVVLAGAEELVVLPALGRVHRGRLRRHLAFAGPSRPHARPGVRRQPAAQTEFHGLRAFRPGDSPRWIHWRTSARCGELMVREFDDVPGDHLVLVADLVRDSPALEAAVSLAATVCWEWCRQKGDRLVLAVAGPEPAVIDGVTGPDLALRALECLAVQRGHRGAGREALLARLASAALPAAPVLLVTDEAGDFADELAARLRRPVARVDATGPAAVDFYEPPAAAKAVAAAPAG